MFGFFKRRDESVVPVAPGTPVDKVSFTPREVFAIMGDVDACVFICNTTTMELLRPALVRPDEWRRRAVERLAPAGIVDDACNPCPELERLLEPLRTRGVEISDGVKPLPGDARDGRSFCLHGTYERSTLIRSRGDGRGRTFTLSDAGSRENWWAHMLRSAVLPCVRSAPPATSISFIEGGLADAGFPESLVRGDAAAVRAFAERWGADSDRLAATSSALAKDRKNGGLDMCRIRLIDATDGDVERKQARSFSMQRLVGGNAYAAEVVLFPAHGFAYTVRLCRRGGMPCDWYSKDVIRRAATFCSIDWLGEEDVLAHLMSNPPFPEHLTTPWRPAGGE